MILILYRHCDLCTFHALFTGITTTATATTAAYVKSAVVVVVRVLQQALMTAHYDVKRDTCVHDYAELLTSVTIWS
jgi:hypothetical protein